MKKVCEYPKCNKEHDGNYASGRFCSKECARGFSSFYKRKEINIKVSKTLSKPDFKDMICEGCNKVFIVAKDKHPKYCKTCHPLMLSKNLSNSLKGKTGGYRRGSGRGKCGWFLGYWCDSSWELAYIFFNLYHNIKFERNTKKYKYINVNGDTRFYMPDFILENGDIIEIKGYIDENTQLKLNTIENLIIIGKKEIKQYINFIELVVGKNFIKIYDNSKYKTEDKICPICNKIYEVIYILSSNERHNKTCGSRVCAGKLSNL